MKSGLGFGSGFESDILQAECVPRYLCVNRGGNDNEEFGIVCEFT